MKFKTCTGWDDNIISVNKLNGSYAAEGENYYLYKNGDWDDIESGIILSEGIVLYRVLSLHFDPVEIWMAVIQNDRLVSNMPVIGGNPIFGGYIRRPYVEIANLTAQT